MNRFLKVKGHSGMVRDVSSGAILIKNDSDYEAQIKARDAVKNRNEQIQQQAEEINNIKNEIGEIKQMLLALLNK
jgi:hypothetical protein